MPESPAYGYRPAASGSPVVSIVTPFYNTDPQIFLQTAESLLRQSLQRWEWIIVNDGTTEPASLRVLLPLRNADARIRVIDQPNCGLPVARNVGAAVARAPLLFFLDSDDLVGPTALEQLAWTLHSFPHSVLATGWSVYFGRLNQGWPRGFSTRYAFLYENMTGGAVMMRRAVFEQLGGYDTRTPLSGLEDNELWLRFAAHGFWGHDVRDYLIWYRLKPPEDYRHYRWEFRTDAGAIRRFRHLMHERYPELYRRGLPHPPAAASMLDVHALIDPEPPFDNPLLHPAGQRRVLVLTPHLVMGGVGRFVVELSTGLTACGDRVTVCLTHEAEHRLLGDLRRATPDVFALATFLQPADYPRFLRYLIESRGITTVLLSNSLVGYHLLAYLRAYCPQATFVDLLHNEEENWRAGGFPRLGLEHDELLDLHIVTSQHLRGWMLARGAPDSRVLVCTTNIDTQRWAPAPEVRARVRGELGLAPKVPVILFAGRLVPQKRVLFVAEILGCLCRRGLEFVCLIAGDGEDRRALQAALRRHNVAGQVRLLGAVPQGRLRELLAASDLLLLPSANEGVALVLYEALAMGVVPVTADVGGQRELVTPECGVLVPPGVGEQARYVDALAGLLGDAELLGHLGRAARQRMIEHFSHDAMVARLQELLDKATALRQYQPRPTVGAGLGVASASLAIEYFQLDQRLRGLVPLRLILGLRRSTLGRSLIGRLARLRDSLEVSDRAMYTARRELAQWLRRIVRR